MIAASSDVLTRALKLCEGRKLEACDLSLCRNSALQADGGNASLPGSTPTAPCRKLNTSSEQGPASLRRNEVAVGFPLMLAAATLLLHVCLTHPLPKKHVLLDLDGPRLPRSREPPCSLRMSFSSPLTT